MSAALLGLAFKARLGDSKTRKLVLLKLVDCCDDDGRNIFPALTTIASDSCCSTAQARRVLREFCAVGLLRKIREGGRGTGSTARYEMDVDLLAKLRRPEFWPALEAAAQYHPKGEDEDDEGAGHAPDAGNDPDNASGDAQILGDMVSPLHGASLTFEGSRVTSGVTQPLSRTLTSEREGASASAGTQTSEGEPADAAQVPTLQEFLDAYPHAKGDNRVQLRAAWEALAFEQRRPAIDGIAAFSAERKAGGLKSRLSAPAYLAGGCWIGLEKQAAQRVATQAAGSFVEVKGWSREWWLMLLLRIGEGARNRVGFAVQQAEAHKSISVSGGDLAAAAKRFGELRPFVCNGPEIDAWRPWFAEHGARIPVFEGSFRVFLPSERPPGGRKDAGDDDVDLT